MKRKVFVAAFALIATSALVLSIFTTNATSLQQLRAKANEAGSYCKPNPGTDCKSHATGNIYPDYIATPYPESIEP